MVEISAGQSNILCKSNKTEVAPVAVALCA